MVPSRQPQWAGMLNRLEMPVLGQGHIGSRLLPPLSFSEGHVYVPERLPIKS